jgi:hypothetical protein
LWVAEIGSKFSRASFGLTNVHSGNFTFWSYSELSTNIKLTAAVDLSAWCSHSFKCLIKGE